MVPPKLIRRQNRRVSSYHIRNEYESCIHGISSFRMQAQDCYAWLPSYSGALSLPTPDPCLSYQPHFPSKPVKYFCLYYHIKFCSARSFLKSFISFISYISIYNSLYIILQLYPAWHKGSRACRTMLYARTATMNCSRCRYRPALCSEEECRCLPASVG